MARSAEGPQAIRSFVGAARGLIIAQVVVALAALGAGGWAVLKIREATDKQEIANAAQEAAQAAKDEAAETLKQSQDYAALLAEFTRASDAKGLADAIAALKVRVERGGADARVYALLASAHFRGADINNAAIAAEEAARLNSDAIAQMSEIGAGSELNEQLYLDLAAYRCAAGFAQAQVADAIKSAPAPALAVLTADGPAAVSAHALLRREDARWLQCRQWVQTQLQTEAPRLAQDEGRPNLFGLRFAYVQAPPDLDEAARARALDILGQNNLAVPGVETISRDYDPGVRYYHAEQRANAERVATALRDGHSGAQWSNFSATQISGSNLPRDRLEVWLPATTARARLSNIRVYYYRHIGDGLLIEDVLRRRLQHPFSDDEGNLVDLARANTISCHPNIPPAAFEEYKALALALVEAGVPIGRMGVFRDQGGGKPIDRVDIIASAEVVNRSIGVLTAQEIQSLTSCRVLDAQARHTQ